MAQQPTPPIPRGSSLPTFLAVILLVIGGAAAHFLTQGKAPLGPVLGPPVVFAIPAVEIVLYLVLIGIWGRGARFKTSVGALLFAIAWRVGMAIVASAFKSKVPFAEAFRTVYLQGAVPAGATILLNVITLALVRRRFFPQVVVPGPAPAEAYGPAAEAAAPVEMAPAAPPAETVLPQAPVTPELVPPVPPPEVPPAPPAPPAEAEAPPTFAPAEPPAEPGAAPEAFEVEAALADALAALEAQEAAPSAAVAEEEPPPLFAEAPAAEGLLAPPTEVVEEEAPLFAEAEPTAEEAALFAAPQAEPAPLFLEEAPPAAPAPPAEETPFAFGPAVEEAPQVPSPEPSAAAAPPAVVSDMTGEVRVLPESVLAQFPGGSLAMDPEAIAEKLEDGCFRIPVAEIMAQLATGEVRVPVSLIYAQLPPGALAVAERELDSQLPGGSVELPLEEIVPQLSPAMLTRTDQIVEELPLEEEPLFQFEIEEAQAAEAPAPVAEAPEVEPSAPPAFAPAEEVAAPEAAEPAAVVEEPAAPLFAPVEEEVPAPGPEAEAPVFAPQAQEVAAPAAPTGVAPPDRVKVKAESILTQFPAEALGMSPQVIADTLPEGCFEIDAGLVIPQLGQAQVRVPISLIVAQLPSGALVKSESELTQTMPDGNVELPLAEVVPQFTALMARPQVQAPEVEELAEPLFAFEEQVPAVPAAAEEAPALAVEGEPALAPFEEAEAASAAEEAAAPPVEEAPVGPEAVEEAPLFVPAEQAPVFAPLEEAPAAPEEAPLFAPATEAPAPEAAPEAVEEAPLFPFPAEELAVAEAPEEGPLFAPEAEAVPAPPAAAPTVTIPGKVRVSAEAILSQIPADALALDPSEVAMRLEHGAFFLAEEEVVHQLSTGEIRVPVTSIADQIPQGALSVPVSTLSNELPGGTVELPLGEVVPQLAHRIAPKAAPEAAAPEAVEVRREVPVEPVPTVEGAAPSEAAPRPVVVEEAVSPPPAEVAAPAPEPVLAAPVAFAFEEIGLAPAERERIAQAEASRALAAMPPGLADAVAGGSLTYFVAPHGGRVALVAPAGLSAETARDGLGGMLTHAQRLAWALDAGDITAILLQAEEGSLLTYAAPGPEGLTVSVCIAAPAGTNLGKAELLAKRALAGLKEFSWEHTPFVEIAPWDRAGDFSAAQMSPELGEAVSKLTHAHQPMGATDGQLFVRADGRKVIAFGLPPLTAKVSAVGSDLADAAATCAEAAGLGAAQRIVLGTQKATVGAGWVRPGLAVVSASADEALRLAKAAVELATAAQELGCVGW